MCILCQRQWAYPITVAEFTSYSKESSYRFRESTTKYVSNSMKEKEYMHEWFKIGSGLEQGFLSYAHMHAAQTTIMSG